MPTILSLSSQVARGLVGQAVNGFVWQRLGFDVISLPTLILSNRPDYPHCAGERLSTERLDAMFQALEQNGFLKDIAAIFTGYLPSAEHVALAARWIERLKADRPGIVYCCDPIFGDEPDGLYIAEEAAAGLRDTLVPMADILTPNRFELGWLTGTGIRTQDDAVAAACRLLHRSKRRLQPELGKIDAKQKTGALVDEPCECVSAPGRIVLATSSPCDRPEELANLAVSADEAWRAVSAFRENVPHGTGDLTAALFLAHYLRGSPLRETLALTAGALESVIAASVGREDLALIAEQDRWASAGPSPVERVPADSR